MYAAGLVAITALGALTIPALADGSHGNDTAGRGNGAGLMDGHGMRGDDGYGSMMQMMRRMHGKGMGGSGMMDALDADGDGTVTPEEMRSGLEAWLTEYDSDGNGTLSLDEFETLHSAVMREMTVDRFQELDNDGDGQVTSEEMTAPADRMERMQQRRAERMDRSAGQSDMDDDGQMMDDGMMDDDAPSDN